MPPRDLLRQRAVESEKLTLNLGHVDLGHIDLLVQEGFYSNRSDFIRTAIRTRLAHHDDALRQSVSRQGLELGLRRFTRVDLEAVRTAGRPLHVHVLGLAVIDDDVDPDLARAAIGSLRVLGVLQAPPAVKSALADRIT